RLGQSADPLNQSSFGPAEAAGAVGAEEAEVAAAIDDVHFGCRAGAKTLKRLDGNEGIIAGGENEGGHLDVAQYRQGGGAAVIIQGVGKTPGRRRDQVVEETHGQMPRKTRTGLIRMMTAIFAHLVLEMADKTLLVEVIARLGEHVGTTDHINGGRHCGY